MEKITKSRLLKSDGTPVDIAVATTGNVWTKSHKIAYGSVFCVSLRAKTETGTPDIDVYLEQTHLDPESVHEGNANATGEGVIGDVYNGWVIPNGVSKVADITDEAWHHFTITPVALPFIRLLLDGQGANPADCTVECYVSQQQVD